MTLVAGDAQHRGGAKTHAFIVGVGRYRHLIGGGDEKAGLPPLAQLTSPPVSARAIADWLIGTPLDNPAAPLGSVELLLSEAAATSTYRPPKPAGAAAVDIERATADTIAAAFDRWLTRCDAHQGNVALFYFCGHGCQKEELMLLPEDFGERPARPWERAIRFDTSYRGMAKCAAKTQCYFIDACRQLTSDMLAQAVTGWALVEPNLWEQNVRIAPKVYATTDGQAAFGDANGVSRYTRALLAALQGRGADKQNGQWKVDTARIGAAVHDIVEQENIDLRLPEADRQIVVSSGDVAGTVILHHLAGPPLVQTIVSCVPDAATAAEFYLTGRMKTYERVPAAPGEWRTDVLAGTYNVAAKFGGTHPDVVWPEDEWIRPPLHKIPIRVQS